MIFAWNLLIYQKSLLRNQSFSSLWMSYQFYIAFHNSSNQIASISFLTFLSFISVQSNMNTEHVILWFVSYFPHFLYSYLIHNFYHVCTMQYRNQKFFFHIQFMHLQRIPLAFVFPNCIHINIKILPNHLFLSYSVHQFSVSLFARETFNVYHPFCFFHAAF